MPDQTVEDAGDLLLVEGLLRQQLPDQLVEHLAVLHEHVERLLVGGRDQARDLLVDQGGGTFGVAAGLAHLHAHELTAPERANLLVTGHSAGGYLTAALLATDWAAAGLPADPIRGAMPISGVFRPAGLIHTTINAAVRLDAAEAAALALGASPPRSRAALTLVVGGDESAEFHRQSERLAADWAVLRPRLVDAAGLNHFTVIDGLADPGSALMADLLALGR